MKKFVFTLSILVYGIFLGQVPQKLSYQAIIRDASNNIVSNQPVGIRISILQGSPTGTPVYVETHNPITNTDGLVSIEIAGGVVISGVFSGIDWSKAPYFLFTEVDPTGGMSYSIFSTTELMSVPYALYAEKSRNPGPAGPQGVQGIAGINGVGINNTQIINDSLKVTLTNGNIINAGYVMGPKGDTGIQGQSGIDGISITNTQVFNDSLKVTLSNGTIINAGYVKGDSGIHGIQGLQGIQGPAGNDGISINNTQVINDSLKVSLSNGTIINAGYVKGAKGDTGVQGAQGIQGPAGNDGISIINSQVINDSLKVTLSNGSIINAGYVKGNTGAQGPSGNDGISITNSQVINDSLKVTLSNGTIINAGHVKGNTGAQGAQGIQGLTGATGPQGANGPSGNDGIGITNSQVINDSLKVTLSNGTIINAGYVKGDIGAQGPQGLTGATGPQGATGATGAQGPSGNDGISITNSQVINDSLKVTLSNGMIINAGHVKGNTGAQGAQGIQGLTGATGPQGANGPSGNDGIGITNTQVINDSLKVTLSNGTIINTGYVKGAKGDTGVQGAQGIQGPAGNDGISIINSQVINDSLKVTLSNGTIINAGHVKGNTGAQGAQGIQGIQGPTGTNGISVTNTQVVDDSLKVTLSNGNIINSGAIRANNGGFMVYNQPGIYSFTVPIGVNKVMVEAWGAGGGGSLGYQPSGTGVKYMGGGGGSGAYGRDFFVVAPGQTYIVEVGAGGAGGAKSNCGGQYECGIDGGSTKFGSLLLANGGAGSCSSAGGIGGTCNALIFQNGNLGGNGTTHFSNGVSGKGGLNVGPNTNCGKGGDGSFCALPWQFSAGSGQNGLIILYW